MATAWNVNTRSLAHSFRFVRMYFRIALYADTHNDMSTCACETNISAELPNVVFLIIEANPDFDNESQALTCKRILSTSQIYTHQQTWVTSSVLRTFSIKLFTSICCHTLGACRDPSSSAWSPKETLAFCRTRMKKCESRWQDPRGQLWI